MAWRSRRYNPSKLAPKRVCHCDHEAYLHKGFTGNCVVSGCGCLHYRNQSKQKYFSKRVKYNGGSYHSKKERDYAFDLDMKLKAGEIKEVKRQIKFPLVVKGAHIANYILDFQVTHNDGSIEYIEVKGYQTEQTMWKWWLFSAIFADCGAKFTLEG